MNMSLDTSIFSNYSREACTIVLYPDHTLCYPYSQVSMWVKYNCMVGSEYMYGHGNNIYKVHVVVADTLKLLEF